MNFSLTVITSSYQGQSQKQRVDFMDKITSVHTSHYGKMLSVLSVNSLFVFVSLTFFSFNLASTMNQSSFYD